MASKSISKSVVWQLAGKFALQGLAFFTTPIFTRILSPEDYGYTAYYFSWVSIFTLIIGLQTFGSIGNARIKYGEDKIDEYLSSIMSISVISFIVIFSFVFCLKNTFSDLLGLPVNIILLALIQSFFSYCFSFYLTKWDQLRKVEKSTIFSISLSVLILGLSLFSILNIEGNKGSIRIYSNAIPTIIYGLIFFIFVYIKGHKVWNKEYILFCLSLTIPLLLHGLGALIFSQCDRIMLKKMENDTSLGIYSVSYALCNVLTIIYQSLNTSWIPFYYDFKRENNESDIRNHTYRYIKFFTVICIGFILLSFDVFKLMAPSVYSGGTQLIPFFVVAFYFDFLYLFPVNFEFYHEKTKLIPIGTILAALINIGVNFILIPKYGIIGAAIGTMIAHFAEFIFHWSIASFIIKEKFEYSFVKFLIGIIIVITFVILVYLFRELWYIRWIIAIFLSVYILCDVIKYKSIF